MSRTLASYKKPIHDRDCGIFRNNGMSGIAALTMNQVFGHPECTCGLAKLLKHEHQQKES